MGNELFGDGAVLTGFAILLLLVTVCVFDLLSRGGTRPVEPALKVPVPEVLVTSEPKTAELKEVESELASLTENVEAAAVEAVPEESPEGMIGRFKQGLNRTRSNLSGSIASLLLGHKAIDEDLLEEIESQLLIADLGVDATNHIIASLEARMERKELSDPEALYQALKNELKQILEPCALPLDITSAGPYVILMVGVNGAGKTTTIGKLAKNLQEQGQSVMLAAGDTFRAAAVEQLQEWGHRNDVPVVAQAMGADSASVIFDALESARAKNIDVLIADTAGRLQNKENLMSELTKIKRVMGKLDQAAPHEVMLVLDAGTGQNAISQAKLFNEAVGVTGIILTKLDGTAKGGVIFAIAKNMQLPIRFIGIGEKIDDLRPFDANAFVNALFD